MILPLPETCAHAYADLRARLAKFESVSYSSFATDNATDTEGELSLAFSRNGSMWRRQSATHNGIQIWETDGKRFQVTDNTGTCLNRPFLPLNRRVFWLRGFESVSDPDASVLALGEVRTSPEAGGALMLDLVVYGQRFTLFLDAETRLPIGYGDARTMTASYHRHRRDAAGFDSAEIRYDVPLPDRSIPGPLPAATVLARALGALRQAPEVRIVRYRDAAWKGGSPPRTLSFTQALDLRDRGRGRDVITLRPRGGYRREAEDETVTCDGTWIVRQKKGQKPTVVRARRNGPPERVEGLELFFGPAWASPHRGTAVIEFSDGRPPFFPEPGYVLHYPTPTSPGTLRIDAQGRPGELIHGRTVLLFQYPERPGEVPLTGHDE